MKKLLPLAATLLLFLASLFGYVLLVGSIQGYATRAGNAARDAEALTQKDSALHAATVALSDTKALADTLAHFVSSDTDVVKGIKLLEEAGRMSGVALTLGAVGVATPEKWKYHEQISIAFFAEGTFGEIVELLSVIEALPHLVRLEGATFEKPEGAPWTVNGTAVFVKQKP